MAAKKTYQQMSRREKLSYLKSVADNGVSHVQRSKSDWREFLWFYSQFYKYRFAEVLLIHEQAPSATACGEIQHWNKVGRRVHKGTKGIPIVNGFERDTEIRYVFDISDTYGEDRGIPRRWSLPERHMGAVVDELQRRFNVPPPTDSQSKNLKWAVEEYARETCFDMLDGIRDDVKGSRLERLDDDSLCVEYRDTVVDSVGYLISERLGLAQGLYDDDVLSFRYLSDFNTLDALTRVGAAVGQISRNVLTLIAQTIQNERNNERMRGNDEARQVHDRGSDGGSVADGGGNRGTGETAEGAAAADRQVREPVREISPGQPSGPIRQPDAVDEAEGRLRRSAGGSAGDDGHDPSPAPGENAEAEGRLHGDGSVRDGDPRPSGGNRAEGDSLQAEVTPDILAEEEAAGDGPPFFLSQNTLEPVGDVIERTLSNTIQRGNYHALAALAPEIVIGESSYMMLTAGEGFVPLTIHRFLENRIGVAHHVNLNGNILADPYMEFVINNNEETLSARSYQHDGRGIRQVVEGENDEVADSNLAGEFDSFALQWLSNLRQYNYQKEKMSVLSLGEEIEVAYGAGGNVTAINGQPEAIDDYMRKNGAKSPAEAATDNEQPVSLDAQPDEISIDIAPSGTSNEPDGPFYYPEHEELYIRESLLTGSGFDGGKERVYNFFHDNDVTGSAAASFLRKEYGTGGRTMDFSDGVRGHTDHNRNGIRIWFGLNGPAVSVSWAQAAGLIKNLVQSGEYFTPFQPSEPDNPQNDLSVGTEVRIDGRKFSVDSINSEYGKVSLRDITFQGAASFPIFREESIDFVLSRLHGLDADKPIEPVITIKLSEIGQQPSADVPHTSKRKRRPVADGQQSLFDITASEAEESDEYPVERKKRESVHSSGVFFPGDIEIVKVHIPQPEDETPKKNGSDNAATTEIDLGLDDDTPTPAPEATPSPVASDALKPPNFRITEGIDIGGGGSKTKYRRNIEVIQLLKTIEAENRYATADEQATLALYAGWGGIPQAFDENNTDWRKEYAELKELLSEQEYRAAAGSTLNAHYTTPEVIEGIYVALDRLGFRGGNVLEPAMGVGNFYGCMPEQMAATSRLHGVELDSITGRIARQLYPHADIQVRGFETAQLSDNFFDAAVSNVPFGSYKLNDPRFDKYNFLIHDFFFAKTLDKVRPGGVIAFITSKGTMDKANTSARRYLAERAELLGAIRLPNTAFQRNAGTEVTTDIIFLKKRDRMVDAENEGWIHTGKTVDGIPLNEYFLRNPHMMLGTMAFDNRMYGGNSETTLNPDGRDLRSALLGAVEFLSRNSYEESDGLSDYDGNMSETAIPADPSVKNFCFAIRDGNIYQRVDSVMEPRTFAKTATERITAMIEMRALTRRILTEQLDGISDDDLLRLQNDLNEQYDRFYKRFGAINSRYNVNLFSEDADFPLLSSIEELDDDGNTRKAAIFTQRTISPNKRVTHVDTPMEALPVCLNERGYVDIGFMADLCDKTPEEVIDSLRGVIFKNPAFDNPDDENNIFVGWETADEYLSGRVKAKLAAAEIAARDNPMYTVNVEALRAVQPKPLEAHEISVRIGVHWIDTDYYRQFILEKLKPPYYDADMVRVHYSAQIGQWTVEKPSSRFSSVDATKTYGTGRMDAYVLFELTLNQKNARITDTIQDADGKERTVLNHKETIAIRERQTKLKEEFRRWIFDSPERREKLCATYNDLFNSERSRQYDGSHLTFPGMSPDVTLRKHQRDGIARILYGGNTLLAHVVGAGKTYTMAAAAMEMKRLGLARKPCFVVPNHIVGQFANEFQRLYPTANILAATKRDFEKQNRRRFCARIATGEWDAVIIGHSSFEKIPVSRERQERQLQSDIDEIEEAIIEAKEQKGSRITVKDLQRALKRAESELKRLRDSPKDDLVSFEELGIDALYTDEAHYYKNRFVFSKMDRVAGLSRSRAKKCTDMYIKCAYINEQNGSSRGLIFSTGTPLSNSMVEMYVMQSYLQREELERLGFNHFDNWAANFGEVVSALELAPSGKGFQVKERFASFVNLQDLLRMFFKIADVQTAEMLNLPVPKVLSGKPITVSVDPSPELRKYTDELVKRSELIHQRKVDPSEDNMLVVTNDGRNAALDMRCIDPEAPDYPDSKVNTCVRNVFEIYQETADNRLTQMIFSDLSTPKGGAAFSVYDDIKAKLIGLGVKPEEIAFIHEAKTDEQKEKMFASVRRGEIRVILGSTSAVAPGEPRANTVWR